MLQLSDAQWSELQRRDAGQFVAAVHNLFLSQRPDMLESPGRDEVFARMDAAHAYAVRAGFASTPHIVRLMYLAADAPRIHDDELVDIYLRKPGATPEQRLDDMLAVMDERLKGNG
jgi:hypothetical protein